MSKEKKYTLDELKDLYEASLYKLTDYYITNFKQSINEYINQSDDYVVLNKLVHHFSREIIEIVPIKYENVCMFAHCFRDNADLLNGIMHESSRDHLYFIESENAIKIGRSISVKRRLSSLQTDNPESLSIKYVKYSMGLHEFAIQRMFSYLKIRGEWFRKHDDIYKYIEILQKQPNEKIDNYSPFIDMRASMLMNDFR